MDNKTFETLRDRIKNDKSSVKTRWRGSGEKWEDSQGNWYGWCDCGFYEYVFYAGTKYERFIDYKDEIRIRECLR